MSTTLNWKEIERLAHLLNEWLKGAELVQIAVPKIQAGKMAAKFEWIYKFKRPRAAEHVYFYLCLRPQSPTLAAFKHKPWDVEDGASKSPFEQKIFQELRGKSVESVNAVKGDRVLLFKFSAKSRAPILSFVMIPAKPDALLLKDKGETHEYDLVAQFRDPNTRAQSHSFASNHTAPKEFEARPELLVNLETWSEHVKASRLQQDQESVKSKLEKQIQDRLKKLEKSIAQSRQALAKGQDKATTDYQKMGDLLKAHLHSKPKAVKTNRGYVYELESDEEKIEVPADLKFSASEQVQRLYDLAKKKINQKKELESRLADLERSADRERSFLERLHAVPLTEEPDLVREIQFAHKIPSEEVLHSKKNPKATVGKAFVSKDGSLIVVGRNSKENLELTLHYAKGNDLWLHVKGIPGSHVIVKLERGKSPTLETLLDAAHLAVYYTKGKDADKTEVDYTYKKHVKSIKGQKEVTYSQNKTLMIDMDSERLQRLLGQ